MSSRKIKIKRRGVNSTLPDQILLEAKNKIGGSLTKSGSILKGITHEEERKFLPRIVGVPYEHSDFMSRTDAYYNKINIPVTDEGTEFEIGIVDDPKDSIIPFLPINLENWLKYKYAISHREVAESKSLVYSDPNFLYYIEDANLETEKTNKSIKDKQSAYKEFIKLSEDELKAELVLRVLAPRHGDKISSFKSWNKEEKENKLNLYLEKDPKYFTEVCSDKDLDYKAEIESMVDSLIITKVGNAYIFGSEPLGDSMEQVIAKLKAPSNSDVYTILKAKLDAFGTGIKKAEKVKASK